MTEIPEETLRRLESAATSMHCSVMELRELVRVYRAYNNAPSIKDAAHAKTIVSGWGSDAEKAAVHRVRLVVEPA